MIGRLEGVLLEKAPPALLLDVGGVGYEVEASMQTHFRLPERGKKVVLFTHQVIREDAHHLFGFIDRGERDVFRILIKANGVGPKLALAILSSLEVKELVRSVAEGDIARLIKVPGVGKKTAERLLVELRDRLGSWQGSDIADFTLTGGALPGAPAVADVRLEAEQALLALGYKPAEASKAVMQADKELSGQGVSVESLLKLALKSMVGR
ncbi:ATP-dependent DNA helicase RuvA [Pokkaliibacter plantistimulans]|uniref:Holliday junction branch migration complex subunit RuvA n=1 Tax=Pokkaliibacter plantistimulans TaxID=1635171 RepID=A0ABX5M201_9GAMM|nr:Holliday junction branch migration protein RuvA [Pokkaliibacter plantistimulans]PXF32537.1 ATP-dependent DNA helicase RuvA [Pokkaliibacter plantistimulans]